MSAPPQVASPVVELTAITIDCRDPAPMVAFYAQAFGGQVSHQDVGGAWIHLSGGPLVLIRRIEDYTPPTWPSRDVPMQMHFELRVDDLEEAERRLHGLGATTCDFQPHRDQGNLVMLDPAGHPFCIGTDAERR